MADTQTTTDWRTIPAGRELDALVAERVMGWTGVDAVERWDRYEFGDPGDMWTAVEQPWCRGLGRDPGSLSRHRRPFLRYSTDIAAAWQVVERLRERFWFRIQTGMEFTNPPTYPATCHVGEYASPRSLAIENGHAAAEAICRAALAAVDARP